MLSVMERNEIDELKARVNLVELFRQHGLELKQNGKGLVCCCPFHPDDTPSLSVSPESGEWNCFGCKAGGDAIRFLQLKEELEFPQALERLKQFAGVQAANGVLPASKYRRPELLARVAELYHKRFLESEPAQAYLNGRGLGAEVWKAFKVGFCDGTLLKTLPSDGELLDALKSIGVLTADGKEHFRGCVVVPLTHPDRGVVAFYGRRIRPDAKVSHMYLPGPRQGVLNWQALKGSPSVVVAESVLDALSLWQAGVREATCLYGVQGLTDDFSALVERFKTEELTLCLDGDRAGLEATQKLSQAFQAKGLRVFAVRLPDDKDPNQVLCEADGRKALAELVRQKEPVAAARLLQPLEKEPGEDAFTLEIGEIRYQIKPMGPFGSRLRINMRAYRGDKWLQDRFDLSLHRDQTRLASQLVSRLGLVRLEAERHRDAIFSHCEGWVTAQQAKTQALASPKAPEMSDEERQLALSWLRHPDLKNQILGDMETLGYVGEENGKLLVYLIGISRKLPRPLSGIILSAAGAGKSSLTELLEQLAPPEDVLLFTRITSQALVYMVDQVLKGKILIVEERVGAEAAEYSIRVLQSRQRLSQAVPIKDPATGNMVTKFFTVEGPVAYLETTTNPKINHENATRCFEITLDESEEQTRRIQEFQRLRRMPSRRSHQKTQDEITRRHHNAQRLLQDVTVYIPYADLLTFPSKKLRTRRDNERFLCLIEASAFLHQFQRERGMTEDGTPYVLANLDDYRLAYELAKDVLSATLHELTRGARDLWVAIRDWVRQVGMEGRRDAHFTRRELRAAISIEDHQLRAALQELAEMEYLEVIQGGTGKTFTYRLAVTEDVQTQAPLLSPEELEARLRRLS